MFAFPLAPPPARCRLKTLTTKGITRENLGIIKNHAGKLVLGFFWLAYFSTFGTSQVNDRFLDWLALLGVAEAIRIFLTMLFVAITLFIIFGFLVTASVRSKSHRPFALAPLACVCLGVTAFASDLGTNPLPDIISLWAWVASESTF